MWRLCIFMFAMCRFAIRLTMALDVRLVFWVRHSAQAVRSSGWGLHSRDTQGRWLDQGTHRCRSAWIHHVPNIFSIDCRIADAHIRNRLQQPKNTLYHNMNDIYTLSDAMPCPHYSIAVLKRIPEDAMLEPVHTSPNAMLLIF